MNRNKALSVLLSAVLLCVTSAGICSNTFAADAKVHTVTVYDFDGKEMTELSVKDGEAADLSGVDTSSLEKHIDVYTQIGFNGWSSIPAKITEDTSVYALYRMMTISLDGKPEKTEYYSNKGNIDLDGLKVTITVKEQLPEQDSSGSFKVETELHSIESKCTVKPETLSEAFAKGNTSQVQVFPIDSEKAILTYDITYFPELGDADLSGSVNASDASAILTFYSLTSTGKEPTYREDQEKRSDVDGNGKVDSNDASLVMVYYALASTGKNADFDTLLSNRKA